MLFLGVKIFFLFVLQRHTHHMAFFCALPHPYLSNYLLHDPAFYDTFFFPRVFPLPLSFCLQPSRRPSLQPAISLDCLSAPSPLHHCHPKQRFASQLSLCLGNPYPTSPCSSSHLPSPPLYSSSLQFPHHFYSPSPPPRPLLPQNHSYYSHSLSQENTSFNPESIAHPSLTPQSNIDFYPPPHTTSDSVSNCSCPHKTNPASCSSNSDPWHFSPLLSQSSPILNTLPCSRSDVCSHTLQNLQPKSDSNLQTLLAPGFHPGCQTDLSTPQHPDSDPKPQHPAVQTCRRRPLVSPASLSHTQRIPPACSAFPQPSTNPHPPFPSLPVTTHPPFPTPCSQRPRPLKAGDVLLYCNQRLFVLGNLSSSKNAATFKSHIQKCITGRLQTLY
ncbi:uncharacterized protein LOC141800845 [Halichoeres trimaculatus]|uniref:uncharacterized protein LOC141800845 n=1 Tax=Halichoeres trimaculatus TaxID=147232 RepID=UPI003D9DF79C